MNMTIRVMIVDDHAVFRSGLRALLEREPDFEVVAEAGSGQETLEQITGLELDIIILDVSMPGMAGTKLCARLLAMRPELAVLILTMHEDEHYVREFLGLGVRGYVLKKSTGTDLVQALRAVHRGGSYIDPGLTDILVSPYVGRSREKKGSAQRHILTAREQEVCKLLALGYSHARVADELNLSPRTVQSHRSHIMDKLGLESRADLVRFAMNSGLLDMD